MLPHLGYEVTVEPMPDPTSLAERATRGLLCSGLGPHAPMGCLALRSTELLVQCCIAEEILFIIYGMFFSGKYIFKLEYNLKSRLRVHQGVRMS